MTNAELIAELRGHILSVPLTLLHDAADALEADEQRIAELEDELRFQLDTRRKETAEIERLKAENLKLQKQNRDCGWNCKQCEYVDKDLQAEEQLPKEGEWIDEQPTVDVVPVVHGEWIFNGRFAELNHYACSNCNRTEFRMSDYCPNCGAKMKGEETDDGIHVRE